MTTKTRLQKTEEAISFLQEVRDFNPKVNDFLNYFATHFYNAGYFTRRFLMDRAIQLKNSPLCLGVVNNPLYEYD